MTKNVEKTGTLKEKKRNRSSERKTSGRIITAVTRRRGTNKREDWQ